jgi:pyruvate/2-oxoglutarate dehydrogenase complex dihydrolipoamide acyltransferase (E2) component
VTRVDVRIPAYGMTDEDCLITQWLREPGDHVEKGEPILEVETSKAEVVIESPEDGVVGEHLVESGAEVPPGTVLTWVEAEI